MSNLDILNLFYAIFFKKDQLMKKIIYILFLCLSINVGFAKNTCEIISYLKDNQVNENYLYGVGMSNLKAEKGIKEAEQRALSDIAQKLKLNIKSNSILGQTAEKTELDSLINIESHMNDLIDIKKIGEIKKTDFSFCHIFALNLKSNYEKNEVVISSLIEKEKSLISQEAHDPIGFLFEIKKVRIDAHELNEKIIDLDIFKNLLKISGDSFTKRVDDLFKELDVLESKNKEKIPFIISYDNHTKKLAQKLKVALSREAYLVEFKGKNKPGVLLELKTLEAPHEIKSPLGYTMIMDFSFIVTNQLNKKAITSVESTRAQGFSMNGKEKEALNSLVDQAFIQVIESLNYVIN